MPAQADLDLTLSGKAGAEEPALVAAEARVPRHVRLAAPDAQRRSCPSARCIAKPTGAHERVVVEVAAPDGAPVDLFVEGPTPDWALPLPEPAGPAADDAPGMRRFTFDLDGLPPGAHAEGATLTLTAVSPADAVEVEAHLD